MTAHEFERAVADVITQYSLLRNDGTAVIVALSGGADSVALAAVLTALGYNVEAAHCNFHLRGSESRRDMEHARAVAHTLDINFNVKDFDVAARMSLTGESVEMAARALRYQWFEALLEREHAQAVAVGHHREDQAETFLLNALRVSGIAGLAAMAPRNGYVVRPLLQVSRYDIEDYLRHRNLGFVVDSSNSDNTYKRNSLRNEVIPTMSTHFDDAGQRLADTARCVRDNLELYNYAVARFAAEYYNANDNTIDVCRLKETLPETVARVLLFEMLRPYGFNMTQTQNILASNTGQIISGDTIAELSRGTLSLRTAEGASVVEKYPVTLRRDITNPVHIMVTSSHISAFNPILDNKEIYLDTAILNGDVSFVLRHPRRGDRMQPYGMTGTKLLSDILKEAHLSPLQKKEAWLLVMCQDNTETIIWAVGIRASAFFTITPATKSFLTLSLL